MEWQTGKPPKPGLYWFYGKEINKNWSFEMYSLMLTQGGAVYISPIFIGLISSIAPPGQYIRRTEWEGFWKPFELPELPTSLDKATNLCHEGEEPCKNS